MGLNGSQSKPKSDRYARSKIRIHKQGRDETVVASLELYVLTRILKENSELDDEL